MGIYDALRMTNEEAEELVDSGRFNSIIEGYCIMAMKQAGFSKEEIARLDFGYLFDSIAAGEARSAAGDE